MLIWGGRGTAYYATLASVLSIPARVRGNQAAGQPVVTSDGKATARLMLIFAGFLFGQVLVPFLPFLSGRSVVVYDRHPTTSFHHHPSSHLRDEDDEHVALHG